MGPLPATPQNGIPGHSVSVLLPVLPLRAFDYFVPKGLDIELGQYVRVPLGPRSVLGVVWDKGSEQVSQNRLRPIIERLPLPPMPVELRDLVDWVAHYYVAPVGAVLRMAMSIPSAFDPPKARNVYYSVGSQPKRMTPQRIRVLDILSDGRPRFAAELTEVAGVTSAVLRGLVKAGHLGMSPADSFLQNGIDRPHYSPPCLSESQRRAGDELIAAVHRDRFFVYLLDGVTGSGKTEVYFEAIAETLRLGRQVLVLLPEIALSAPWLEHFKLRFGVRPAIWHSELGLTKRRETWRGVSVGSIPLIVGARSALFLPFSRLGLIVVDEEHDSSYKQEDGVVYNARDVAVVRGRLTRSPVILASATPSLESHNNANKGRYIRLNLPTRHGQAELPAVEIVDLRLQPPPRGCWLSPLLIDSLRSVVGKKEQAMLFLNRRGYAPLSLCRQCGFRLTCPNCTSWLVEHRLGQVMRCHHCGHEECLSEFCPECKMEGTIVACGPGVERVAEELSQIMPDVTFKVMTSDTMSSVRTVEKLVKEMLEGRIDVLIGTQIVTKGYHFPKLTLVGVVDADLGLSGGDLRAGERNLQLLSQVSGRAGRANRPGRVLLQTYMSKHPVMQALCKGDRDGFFSAELAARDATRMPPFSRLVAFIVSSNNEVVAQKVAADIARLAPHDDDLEVLGPAPAPIYQQRGKFRFRLLIKAPRRKTLQNIVRTWLTTVSRPNNVSIRVDVDPYSFM